MVQRLFTNLAAFLIRPNIKEINKEYLDYAKTEYRNDWQYAYQYMLDNEGKGPKDKRYIR